MVMMMVEKEVAHLASENKKKKKKNEGNMTTIFIFYGGK